MRPFLGAVVLCSLLAGCRAPQKSAPATDDVADATGSVPYVDERFHFVFTPPAPLRSTLVSDPSLSADHPDPNEIALFSAREPGTASGLRVFADRLDVATAADPLGANDGSSFLGHAAASLAKQPGYAVLRQTHANTPSGWMLDELDYKIANRFAAILTLPVHTPEGRFLIVFRSDAGSRAELDRMTAAVRAARLL